MVLIRPQAVPRWAGGFIRELQPGLWPGYRAGLESRLGGVIGAAIALG